MLIMIFNYESPNGLDFKKYVLEMKIPDIIIILRSLLSPNLGTFLHCAQWIKSIKFNIKIRVTCAGFFPNSGIVHVCKTCCAMPCVTYNIGGIVLHCRYGVHLKRMLTQCLFI